MKSEKRGKARKALKHLTLKLVAAFDVAINLLDSMDSVHGHLRCAVLQK
jgi:hypothetical protein